MFQTWSRTCFKLLESLEISTLTSKRFAGHSKWQNIRHVKGAKDAQRAALFQRLSRQIRVAITEGGSSDLKSNLKLENAVEQCKRASMPAATLQSVLKSCENDKSNSKAHTIEIKGPGGCIILAEVFTGSIHQFRQSIVSTLKKHQSKLSDGGGVHCFEEKGIIDATIEGNSEKTTEEIVELATEHAIESGAEDVKFLEEDNSLQFISGATSLKNVVGNLEKFYKISSASVEFIPLKEQKLDESQLELCAHLYDKLENLPEVVRLSDNIAM